MVLFRIPTVNADFCMNSTLRIGSCMVDSISTIPSCNCDHYYDVIMDAMPSQITSLTIVCSAVYSDADQRKHQSSASLAFVRWIHRWPVNSPHKGPVTRKMFPFDDVIMNGCYAPDACWPLNVAGVRQGSQPIHSTEPVTNQPNPAEVIHPANYKPPCAPKVFYGVVVGQICWLIQ